MSETNNPVVIGEAWGYVFIRKGTEAILYAPDGEIVTRAPIEYDPNYLSVLGSMFGTMAALHKVKAERGMA